MGLEDKSVQFFVKANCSEFSDVSLHDSDDDGERLVIDFKEVAQQINETDEQET